LGKFKLKKIFFDGGEEPKSMAKLDGAMTELVLPRVRL